MTKYIGETLRGAITEDESEDTNVVCIGICPWNSIKNHLSLIGKDTRSSYNMPSALNSQDAYLDNNHTNFLLADNNYAAKNGEVIDLSAALVTGMRKLQYEGRKLFLFASKKLLRFLCGPYLLTSLFTPVFGIEIIHLS